MRRSSTSSNTVIFHLRFYITLYHRRINWCSTGKCGSRRSFPRYLLCGSPLPLCLIHGCRFCYVRWLLLLNWKNYWSKVWWTIRTNSFLNILHWSKRYLLSYALSRSFWNATPNIRLSRCFCALKFNRIFRIIYFCYCYSFILLYTKYYDWRSSTE